MRLLVTDAAKLPLRQATAWLIMTLGRNMKNRILYFVFIFFTLMVIAPIATGCFGLGGKRGPFFYPESIHDLFFSIGCKIGGRPIPKSSFVQPMMQRAYFFGINERPLSRSEREMKIEDMKKRGVNAHYLQGQIDFHEQLNNEGA